MRQDHVAHASVKIHARPEKVWNALTNPELVRRYMAGTNVDSSWAAGSPITWRGEHQGKTYEDHGKVLRAERPRVLEYTHASPNQPENYHTVTIVLEGSDDDTAVRLSQEGNQTEEARVHSEENWRQMLDGLRVVVEERNGRNNGGDR